MDLTIKDKITLEKSDDKKLIDLSEFYIEWTENGINVNDKLILPYEVDDFDLCHKLLRKDGRDWEEFVIKYSTSKVILRLLSNSYIEIEIYSPDLVWKMDKKLVYHFDLIVKSMTDDNTGDLENHWKDSADLGHRVFNMLYGFLFSGSL